jgi:alpha-L-rhamnosidase
MLGHLMEWFYSGAGGIKQYFDDKGECCIEISPEIVKNITWANTTYNSVHGEIRCNWKRSDDVFSINVTVPFNCSATVVIPQADPGKIFEGEIPLQSSAEVKFCKTANGKTYLTVPAGDYNFRTSFKEHP